MSSGLVSGKLIKKYKHRKVGMAGSLVHAQEEKEKIKRQIVWAHVLRTVYFIVAYEDDTYNIRPFRLLTDRFHIQALQCLCSLAP